MPPALLRGGSRLRTPSFHPCKIPNSSRSVTSSHVLSKIMGHMVYFKLFF